MGTMSRYQDPGFGVTPKQLRRADIANRTLSGQRLADVLTVIHYKSTHFNRKTRRIAFQFWRKHCRKHGLGLVSGLKLYKGQIAHQDSPAGVQSRLLFN